MAERSNAAVLKTVDPKGPGVRIPLSPPKTILKEVQSPKIVDFGLCLLAFIVNLYNYRTNYLPMNTLLFKSENFKP